MPEKVKDKDINMGKNQPQAKISAKSALRLKLLDLLKSKALSVSTNTPNQKKADSTPPSSRDKKEPINIPEKVKK